jgi:high-affinity Fe2+/Pb2+ permease
MTHEQHWLLKGVRTGMIIGTGIGMLITTAVFWLFGMVP